VTAASTATDTWELWSTDARLVVTEPETLPKARRLVHGWLDLVDDAANRFRPDSEVNRIAEAHGPVKLTATLTDLLEQALLAADLTDGDVDPTVGAAMRRIGYDRDLELVSDDGPLRAVIRPVPGYRRLRLRGRELSMPSGVELDLGATAKAVAADRAAELVHQVLGTGVLVALGGDIATAGQAPDGGWQVLVQDRPEDAATQLELAPGTAVATSSTVARQWRRGGRTLHHVVDPRTGQPAKRVWRSVTVAGPTCLVANAVSTAAIIRGEAAPAWVAGLGLPARFLRTDGAVLTTDSWPRGAAA
jgi:thiamine biosynthesis lipoprotein